MKNRPIKELRQEMFDSETPVSLAFGLAQDSPNHYRLIPEALRNALRPLNTPHDFLVIPGTPRGMLPTKPLRDWLEYAPDELWLEIRPDCLVVTGGKTRATFKLGPTYAYTFKQGQSLVVTSKLAYALVDPGHKPTKSELMTILNRKRAEILKRRAARLKDLREFSPRYRPGRMEVIERDTQDALKELYRAFGRLQSKEWAAWATENYQEQTSVSYQTLRLWQEITAYRELHEVTQELSPRLETPCTAFRSVPTPVSI